MYIFIISFFFKKFEMIMQSYFQVPKSYFVVSGNSENKKTSCLTKKTNSFVYKSIIVLIISFVLFYKRAKLLKQKMKKASSTIATGLSKLKEAQAIYSDALTIDSNNSAVNAKLYYHKANLSLNVSSIFFLNVLEKI